MSTRPTLVIGNKNYSSWSLRPWLLLRQFGVAFDEVKLPLDTPEFYTRIKDYSPAGRVPVLIDGATHVWDSLAICEYANDYLLDHRGWPSERAACGWARAVAAEMHSGFSALRTAMPMNARRKRPALTLDAATAKDVARVRAIWREARERHAAQGPFLFGEFTIADAMYAPVALRFISYSVELDAVERAWVDTMLALPAMREWLAEAATEELEPEHEKSTP
ncbi:MAG: glutathione S-transferase family protein [Proteobacteria bacterium]|nr:glutathione S-transferase family protein [Pseudomonadota bacterium]